MVHDTARKGRMQWAVGFFSLGQHSEATSVVKFNYIHSDVKDVGRANILLLRYQFRPLPIPGWR